MGAINGRDFVNRLNRLKSEIWFDGKKIDGLVSEHPYFKGVVGTKASLYDLQLHPTKIDEMTYTSPTSGERVGLSFLQPKTKEDLWKRRNMIEQWAKVSGGLMGRSPDYLNTLIMSFASTTPYLKGKDNCFPDHLQAVYEMARDNDLCFTHTFITPQVNRSQFYFENTKEPINAKVVDENEAGIVIKGARLLATQGGLTDEILVLSAGQFLSNEDEAFAFSIPANTKGLKFICRDSFIGGDSPFDHPLSSKYEETDALVVFDNVLVPWERVFYYNNSEVAEQFMIESSFHAFAKHQVVTRQIVKLEFLYGIAESLIQTIGVREYQHIQEKMAEIITGLETMRALLEKSENHAALDKYGYMRPDLLPLQVAGVLFPKIYPRFTEIIQLIGASGMINLPPETAFHSPIREDLDRYLQSATKPAFDRVKLFRLAWDLTMSAFGTRQTQYERYFFGDPIRLSSELYRSFSGKEYVANIEGYLNP